MMDVDKIKFTSSANRSIEALKTFVVSKNHNIANSSHIFYLCLTNVNDSFMEFVESRGIELKIETLDKLIDKACKKNPDNFISATVEYRLCESVNDLIRKAFSIAHTYGHWYVGVEHLVYAFLEQDSDFNSLMFEAGIDTEHLKLSCLAFLSGENAFDDGFEYEEDEDEDDEDSNPNIDVFQKYCSNLNVAVQQEGFPKVSGRDREIQLIEEILCRKTKSNCVLVGEAGTGKTTIVEGLAQIISQEDYSGPLQGKVIYSLDLSSIVAGTKYRGQFEDRFNKLLIKLKQMKNVILFIDEIHTIIGTGSREGSQDLANMLKPALARGEISCIGATTSTEYKKYFEKDPALTRRFHPINVEEPSSDEVLKMLKGAIPSYESHHNIIFSNKVIEETVKMCEVYLPNQRFPDKAFDVIDQASSKARIKGSTKVHIDDVCDVIADKIGVCVNTIKESKNNKFSEFEANVCKKVFGQKENVKKIYETLACAKAGFKDKNKPIASFFFVGPTSVGKTFTAKQIAKNFYGNENSFLQLNMSEYQESTSISRLIGASAGYVGYEDGGLLTEFVRKNPNSLILFDEAEKCNPNILNLLLQILDEAKLTDNLNRTVDFSRTIVVLTSNIGADMSSKNQMGFVIDDVSTEQAYKISVRKALAPELVARIDDIVVFDNLDRDSLIKIVESKLQEIQKTLNDKKINVNFEFGADFFLPKESFGSDHARNIKKTIREKVEIPLSQFIVKNPKKKNISAKMLDGNMIVW